MSENNSGTHTLQFILAFLLKGLANDKDCTKCNKCGTPIIDEAIMHHIDGLFVTKQNIRLYDGPTKHKDGFIIGFQPNEKQIKNVPDVTKKLETNEYSI